MKKSHRKDVMIARIIFAAVCVVLIAIISVVVMFVRLKNAQQKPDTQPTQTQPANLPPQDPDPALPPVTQVTEPESGNAGTEALYERIVWTNNGVNLRTEPKENGGRVIRILLKGTKLQITGEAGEWVKVIYSGSDGPIEGYVKSEYLTDKDPISGKSP